MNYLITGASGFIGSNVIKHALSENIVVHGSTRKKNKIHKTNFQNNPILDPKTLL